MNGWNRIIIIIINKMTFSLFLSYRRSMMNMDIIGDVYQQGCDPVLDHCIGKVRKDKRK